MAEVMVGYSNSYADQVEKDYERFAAACRSGRQRAPKSTWLRISASDADVKRIARSACR